MMVRDIYYRVKPLIPRSLQIALRRKVVLRKRSLFKNIWPIDEKASITPDGWTGWPENKKFALVLTHDVDTTKGQVKCYELEKLERELGFVSSFNFVPERYDACQKERFKVCSRLRHFLENQGFEVGVHGLRHDGDLYRSEKIFKEHAKRINHYLREWGSVGFRSPSMHHKLEWIHDLNIEYDTSTFDTDPFEPQPEGVGTIFPFWVQGNSHKDGYVELPYTLPQDFTLFILMKEKNINIWKKKLHWIVEKGGMALVNVHPDYMNFGVGNLGNEEYPAKYYRDLLEYIKLTYEGQYWHALPKDMARFWLQYITRQDHKYGSI